MRYLTLTLLVCLFAASAPFGHRPGMRHVDASSMLFSAQRADRIDLDRLRPERTARFGDVDVDGGPAATHITDSAL